LAAVPAARISYPTLIVGLVGGIITAGGGWLISTLPLGTWALHVEPYAGWHRDHSAFTLALISVLGLGLMAWAWFRLIRNPAHARLTAAIWLLPFFAAPPLYSEDAYAYGAQGMLVRLGISPYTHGVSALGHGPLMDAVNTHWQDTPTPYGPLHLWIGDLLTHISQNPLQLAVLHRIQPLIGWILLAWAAPRLARIAGLDADRVSAIVLASPFIYGISFGGIHNDLTIAGLIACAFVVAKRVNWIAASAVLAVAMSVKLTAGLALLPIALLTLPVGVPWPRRFLRLACVGAVAVALTVAISFAFGYGFDFLKGLEGAYAPPSSVSPVHWVAWWAPEGLIRALAVIAILVISWVALRTPTGDWQAALAGFTGVCLAVIVFATPVRLPYLVWFVPAAAAAPLKRGWLVPMLAVVGVMAPLTPLVN
jgi:hypothetical protein